jgi:hypothetical protein
MLHFTLELSFSLPLFDILLGLLMPKNWNETLRYNRSLARVHYSRALEYFKHHTLRKMGHDLDVMFPTQSYLGFKYCPFLLEAVGLRSPSRFIWDSLMFNFSPSIINYPSARCTSTADVFCTDFDVFKQKPFPLVTSYNNCGTVHILDINNTKYKLTHIPLPTLFTSFTQHWQMLSS